MNVRHTLKVAPPPDQSQHVLEYHQFITDGVRSLKQFLLDLVDAHLHELEKRGVLQKPNNGVRHGEKGKWTILLPSF